MSRWAVFLLLSELYWDPVAASSTQICHSQTPVKHWAVNKLVNNFPTSTICHLYFLVQIAEYLPLSYQSLVSQNFTPVVCSFQNIPCLQLDQSHYCPPEPQWKGTDSKMLLEWITWTFHTLVQKFQSWMYLLPAPMALSFYKGAHGPFKVNDPTMNDLLCLLKWCKNPSLWT